MKFFKDSNNNIRAFESDGSQDNLITEDMVEVSAPPTSQHRWNGSDWYYYVENKTEVSKLALMDALNSLGLWDTIKVKLQEGNGYAWDRWMAASVIDIADPGTIAMRQSMGKSEQWLQDLFNSL